MQYTSAGRQRIGHCARKAYKYRVRLHLYPHEDTGGLLLVRAHIYAPILPFLITVAAVVTAAIVFVG